MTRYLMLLACLTGFAALSGTASAATRDEQKQACQGDAIRLCTFAIPNEAKITACMRKKMDQLSPKCRAMFEPAPQKKCCDNKAKKLRRLPSCRNREDGQATFRSAFP